MHISEHTIYDDIQTRINREKVLTTIKYPTIPEYIPKHNWLLLNQHSTQRPRCRLKQDCGNTRIDCTKTNLVGITKGTLLHDSTLYLKTFRN